MTLQRQKSTLASTAHSALLSCGVNENLLTGSHEVYSPITGELLLSVQADTKESVLNAIGEAQEAFLTWRDVPAPVRGQVVKRWAELHTKHKQDLAALVTAEAGKIVSDPRASRPTFPAH